VVADPEVIRAYLGTGYAQGAAPAAGTAPGPASGAAP
jgi:hypothetical protein